VALSLSLASACSTHNTTPQKTTNTNASHPKIVLDQNRFISGPYGQEHSIRSIVNHLNQNGKAVSISNQGLKLPNKPINEIVKIYRNDHSQRCNAHDFKVIEGNELLILQYSFTDANGQQQQVRDYIEGPDPFTSPGLWGPYDHTASSAYQMFLMMGDTEEDGMGLLDTSYAIGWMTPLNKSEQWQIGAEYQKAIRETAVCLAGTLDSMQATKATMYTIQQGDTLSSISHEYYGTSRHWRQLFNHNRATIKSPNILHKGTVIELPNTL